MLVNGAVAKRTSARHGNTCLAVPPQQCAEEVVRSTHSTCALIGYAVVCQSRRRDADGGLVQIFNLCAHLLHDAQADGNIADIRYVLQNTGLIAEQNSRNQGNRCILCSADFYFSRQAMPAVNDKFIQFRLSFVCTSANVRGNRLRGSPFSAAVIPFMNLPRPTVPPQNPRHTSGSDCRHTVPLSRWTSVPQYKVYCWHQFLYHWQFEWQCPDPR